MIDLRNGPLHARLLPAAGGRIASLTHERHGDILVAMEEAQFDPEFWPKAGAYPLIPFHNRIRGGKFSWDGEQYQLPLHPSEPNALHGFSSRRQWSETTVSPAHSTMTLDHEGDDHWPWALHAHQDIRLEPDALLIRLSVTNRSNSAMPAGLGWHPYFTKALLIEDDAKRGWPIGSDLMPLGESTTASIKNATRYLSDWRQVRMTLPGGMRMSVTAEPLLSHLVIHDVEQAYTCVEPTSHLANALNCEPQATSDKMVRLSPGKTLAAGFRISFL